MSYAPGAPSPSARLDFAVAVSHRTPRRWNATICRSLVLILGLFWAPVPGSLRAQPLPEVLRLALADGFTIEQFARALDATPSVRTFDGASFRVLAFLGQYVEPRCRAMLGAAVKATLGQTLTGIAPYSDNGTWGTRLRALPLPDARSSRHRSLVVIVGKSNRDHTYGSILDDAWAEQPPYFNGRWQWYPRSDFGYWHRHDKDETYSEMIVVLLSMDPDIPITRCDDVESMVADLADALLSDRVGVLRAPQETEVPVDRRTAFLVHHLRIVSLLASVPPPERGAYLRAFTSVIRR